MKRTAMIAGAVFVALLVVGGWFFFGGRGTLVSEEVSAEQATEPIAAPAQVSADGYVVPERYASLSVATPGRIREVRVLEGGPTQEGAILVTLENEAQQAALAQSEAARAEAEAHLAQLQAGSRPQEIAEAQAAVDAAQAQLDRLLGSPTQEEIASAQQAVKVAAANLAVTESGPSAEELNAATAVVQSAEAALKQAQAVYDKVAWRSDIGELPQSVQLEQATIEYQRALASYRNLLNGATPEEIQVYREQVGQAQATLNEVLAGPRTADLDAARAELRQAQAALELSRAGARPEEIRAAEAEVAAAAAVVAQSQAALEQTYVRAPFAGTVHALDAVVGQYVTPGMTLVRLGATDRWVVETDNLSELDVVKLAIGDRVEVTIDAWPGRSFGGAVESIQPASQIKRGTVTYLVTVRLEPSDVQLLWGLSANVRKP